MTGVTQSSAEVPGVAGGVLPGRWLVDLLREVMLGNANMRGRWIV